MRALREELVAALRTVFGSHVEDFVVQAELDAPVPSLNFSFTVYGYFVIGFEYDRGRFGFSVLYERPVGIPLDQHTSSDLEGEGRMIDLAEALREAIRLRIPSPYLDSIEALDRTVVVGAHG